MGILVDARLTKVTRRLVGIRTFPYLKRVRKQKKKCFHQQESYLGPRGVLPPPRPLTRGVRCRDALDGGSCSRYFGADVMPELYAYRFGNVCH